MTIYTLMDEKTFRTFTIFDILKRRQYWKSPVTFASILTVSAIVCYLFHSIDGAVLLGTVLLIVGLGMPVLYFSTFFLSLRKQVKVQHLDEPRLVYTVNLDEDDDGIHVKNQTEKAVYKWKDAHHAYRDWGCIYLYITKERAFLLTLKDEKDEGEAIWSLIVKMMGREKCTDIRKKGAP